MVDDQLKDAEDRDEKADDWNNHTSAHRVESIWVVDHSPLYSLVGEQWSLICSLRTANLDCVLRCAHLLSHYAHSLAQLHSIARSAMLMCSLHWAQSLALPLNSKLMAKMKLQWMHQFLTVSVHSAMCARSEAEEPRRYLKATWAKILRSYYPLFSWIQSHPEKNSSKLRPQEK